MPGWGFTRRSLAVYALLAELGRERTLAQHPEYLDIEETARLLKLSPRAVYDKFRARALPGVAKVGGKWRVNRQKLIEWMDAGGELADEQHDGGQDAE